MVFYYLLIGMPCLSLISILMYGLDKRQARLHGSRIPESTLLLFDFLGGWPGGAWAQVRFRHKTMKRSYRIQFVLAVVANLSLIGLLAFIDGRVF